MSIQEISNSISTVSFKGVIFKDINPLLANRKLYSAAIDFAVQKISKHNPDVIAGIDSRGFIIGQSIADRMNLPFTMIRKAGKMPNTIKKSYKKEYGEDTMEVQLDLFPKGTKVVIVDDLIATGGTLCCAAELMEEAGYEVVDVFCLIQLQGFQLPEKLKQYNLNFVLSYATSGELATLQTTRYLPTKPRESGSEVVVFYHPSMKEIADGILCYDCFREGFISWEKFPDKWDNITFENNLENKRVVFIGSLFDPTTFLEQLSFIKVLPRQGILSLDFYLPYYGSSTHERVDYEGMLATAETTASIISSCMSLTKEGPARIHIYDIHCVVERFYFSDNIVYKGETAIELFKSRISPTSTIMFPDMGAYKRFRHCFINYKMIVCSKVRDGDKRNIIITDKYNWPLPGYDSEALDDVIIVDDIANSGGTLMEGKKAAISFGAKRVSAYVTHAVFPNNSHTKMTGFHKFYVTNTNPMITSKLKNNDMFEIIDISPHISASLMQSLGIKNALKKKSINVYVASSNTVKLNVVHDMFAPYYSVEVFGTNAKSGVPEQPINEETLQGCMNRLNATIEQFRETADFVISIESGIDTEKMVDYCEIAVYNKEKGSVTNVSSLKYGISTPVPIDFQSFATNRNVTVGSLIEKAYGYSSWHDHFGTVSRYNMMLTTLNEALK